MLHSLSYLVLFMFMLRPFDTIFFNVDIIINLNLKEPQYIVQIREKFNPKLQNILTQMHSHY